MVLASLADALASNALGTPADSAALVLADVGLSLEAGVLGPVADLCCTLPVAFPAAALLLRMVLKWWVISLFSLGSSSDRMPRLPLVDGMPAADGNDRQDGDPRTYSPAP